MALLYRQYWVAFGLYIACFFIDERAFLAVPLVCVARFFLHRDTNKWQRGLPEVGLAIAAIVTGLLVRFWLHTAYGLENGATSENLGLATARDNFQISGFGLLTGLDFWTFAGMFPAFLAWQKGWRWLASGYLIYYICCFLAMLLVLDLTRCTAYLFPAALAGVIAIARQERPVFAERFVLFFTLTALLFPPVFVVGDYILWMGPIFPKLVRVVAQLGFGVHI
jgi:hypothetical protein